MTAKKAATKNPMTAKKAATKAPMTAKKAATKAPEASEGAESDVEEPVEEVVVDDRPSPEEEAALVAMAEAINAEVGSGSRRGDQVGQTVADGEDVTYVLTGEDIAELVDLGLFIADLAPGDCFDAKVVGVTDDFVADLVADLKRDRRLNVADVEVIDPPDEVGAAHFGKAF